MSTESKIRIYKTRVRSVTTDAKEIRADTFRTKAFRRTNATKILRSIVDKPHSQRMEGRKDGWQSTSQELPEEAGH